MSILVNRMAASQARAENEVPDCILPRLPSVCQDEAVQAAAQAASRCLFQRQLAELPADSQHLPVEGQPRLDAAASAPCDGGELCRTPVLCARSGRLS